MTRIRLAAPLQEELLGGGLPPRHHFRGDLIGVTVGQACGARDDAHHLRGQATEIFACLLVRDLVELAELPLAGEACSLGLQVGRRVAGQTCGLIRLRIGQPRVEVVVDEQAPHVVVGVVADELLDVDAAVAKRAAFPVGLGDLRLDGDDALETRLEVVGAAHLASSSSISRPTDRSRAAASTRAAAAASWTATPTDLYRVI